MGHIAPLPERVRHALRVIEGLNAEERTQLYAMLPLAEEPVYRIDEKQLAEAVEFFRASLSHLPPHSPDDEFIGGLTYEQYFALSDKEAEAVWDELYAQAPSLDNLPEVEVRPDARIPARQKHRSQNH